MKKIISLIALTFALIVGLFLCACTSNGELSAPEVIDIDENNTLSWLSVRNARSYRIEIRNVESNESVEDTTRRTYYSLERLQEGDYEIRLMAIGGNQNDSCSKWTDAIDFHKDYATGLVYTLINNGTEYMISKVGTAQGDVVIEDIYRGKPVTRIADAAFRASGKLESIVIGNKVTVIGNSAFYQCPQLVSVTIPDSVTSIGVSAFQGCSQLTEIKIPDGVTVISDNMFAYCRALKKIELSENVKAIGSSAFYACSALDGIELPDSVQSIGAYAFSGSSASEFSYVSFGSGIQKIGEYAFSGCNALSDVAFKNTDNLLIDSYAFGNCVSLVSIELPNGLTELGSHAFYGADSLVDVTIPDSVTAIGESAFNATALYREQEESNTYGGLIYADNWLVATTGEAKSALPEAITADSSLFKKGVVGFAMRAFANVTSTKSITLPNSVKYIGAYAFNNNTALYSFLTDVQNSNLQSLGSGAFMGCDRLGNIRLNGKLKTIGDYAFYDCSSVTNNLYNPDWLVPASVESIGQSAFSGTELYNNPDESGVIYAGKWVVGYDTLTTSDIELVADVKGIADQAFFSCDDLRSVSGMQRVEHIGTAAFAYCSNLTSVGNLYRYMERIEPYTFYDCGSLFSIGLPLDLKYIGSAAFAKCSQLSEIDFSDTMTKYIDDFAFYNCSNVAQLALCDTIESIGDYAFYGINQVTELVLPDSVRTIGERAFGWCTGLETLVLNDGLEEIGNFAFRNCSKVTSLTIPDSVKTIGDYAFYQCSQIADITLGSGVEQIGTCAFYGLSEISSLELPTSLKYVGDYAFMGCTMLRSVLIRGEIDYVGKHAFYACSYMTAYAAQECDVSEQWNVMWNSSYRPVVWGSSLSEDGYVISVTVGDNTIANLHATFGFSGPYREGYKFLGWSKNPNATEAELSVNGIRTAERGTTLYAVWEKAL